MVFADEMVMVFEGKDSEQGTALIQLVLFSRDTVHDIIVPLQVDDHFIVRRGNAEHWSVEIFQLVELHCLRVRVIEVEAFLVSVKPRKVGLLVCGWGGFLAGLFNSAFVRG